MNERIRELALEARVVYYSKNGAYEGADEGLSVIPSAQSLEKFAELIVKRCIQVCDGNHEYKNRTDTDFGKGVSVGIQMSKEQIKAHFGVEQ